MAADDPLVRLLAPQGRLRASLNMGNTALAQSLTSREQPAGVSIDLARALAARLCVPCDLLEKNTPGASLATLAADQADVGFLAVDPKRAEQVYFTVPYARIGGAYAAQEGRGPAHASEVDRAGMTVVLVATSAYDLHLSRSLQHAKIVRVSGPELVFPELLGTPGDAVAAGVRQIWSAPGGLPAGARLLQGDFMTIDQCMAVPRTRGDRAFAYVDGFLRRKIAEGFVAEAFRRHGVEGVEVPPLENAT